MMGSLLLSHTHFAQPPRLQVVLSAKTNRSDRAKIDFGIAHFKDSTGGDFRLANTYESLIRIVADGLV